MYRNHPAKLIFILSFFSLGTFCSRFVNFKNKLSIKCSRITLELKSSTSSSGFDSDFANSISKPLPEWYIEEQRSREEYLKELEIKKKIEIEEFRKKYELTNEEKAEELAALRAKRAKKGKNNVFQKAFGFKNSVDEDSLIEDELTTKEKWEKFLADEEKDTGFYLPGFFEVFPELMIKWPKWARRRDGGTITCKTDKDCLFPQACCPHPFIPTEKFCCTGWGQRVMVPKYVGQEAIAQQGPRGGQNARDPIDPRDAREPWRPERG